MCLWYVNSQISDYIKVWTTQTVRFTAAVCKMSILQPKIEYQRRALKQATTLSEYSVPGCKWHAPAPTGHNKHITFNYQVLQVLTASLAFDGDETRGKKTLICLDVQREKGYYEINPTKVE